MEKYGGPIRNVGNIDPTAVIRFWSLLLWLTAGMMWDTLWDLVMYRHKGSNAWWLSWLIWFTSDSASNVERTGIGGTSSEGDEGRWKFYMLHFPYASYINKSRVYTRVSSDTVADALMIRKFIWYLKIWSRGPRGASVWLLMISLLALFWLYSW